MKSCTKQLKKDSAEEILDLIEKEEKQFRTHWVWKELCCTPEEFFKAVKKHVDGLKIPKQQWDEAYRTAKEASRIRSVERRQSYHPANFGLMSGGALRV